MFWHLCVYIYLYSYQWLRGQDFIPSGCVVWRRTLWIAPCPGQNGSFVALEAVLLLGCVCVWIFSSNLRVCYMENEWTWPVYRWFTTKNGDFPWRTLIAITKRWGNEKQGRVHPQNRHGLKFPWERTPKWRDQIPNQCFVCVLFDIGRDFIEHL